MNKTFIYTGAIALTLGLGFAPQSLNAQVTRQGSGFAMSLKLTKGATYKYMLNAVIDASAAMGGTAPRGQSAKQTMKSPISMRVVDVKNGISTVQVTQTPPSMGGTAAKPQTVTIKIDRTGKVTEGNEAGVMVSLPTKPVRIGETWTSTSTTRGMGIPMQVTTRATLKAVRAAGGRQVAEISVVTSAKGSGMSGTGRGSYTIDAKDGMILTYNLVQTMNMTMPAQPAAAGSKTPAKPRTISIPTTMTLTRQ